MSKTRNENPIGYLVRLAKNTRLDDPSSEVKFHYVRYIKPPKKRVISFKGGGVRVFVYQKFLEIAHQNGTLADVKEIGGSSSGSIAAIFAATHYENSHDRSAALESMTQVDVRDLMIDDSSVIAYQMAKPLQMVSKPLAWLGSSINWLGRQVNNLMPSLSLGSPFQATASMMDLLSQAISPESVTALHNLVNHGGIYHGKKIQLALRDLLQIDVQKGLAAILTKIPDQQQRHAIITHLNEIGLCVFENNKCKVVPDITFRHFYELAKLPGSQFKELYMTGIRIRDKALLVFNYKNSPDYPIHKAARAAMALPRFFKPGKYQNEDFFDGGTIDNSPVLLATEQEVDPIYLEHGITDFHARLAVRVEYPDSLINDLWNQTKPLTGVEKYLFQMNSYIFKLISYGIDSFETDAKSLLSTQNDFAHNTLQMEDFNLSRMDTSLTPEKRAQYLEQSAERVLDYFNNHADEVAVIQHLLPPSDHQYEEKISARDPQVMPKKYYGELLSILEDYQQFPTQELFHLPQKSCDEEKPFTEVEIAKLEMLRGHEIKRIKKLVTLNRSTEQNTARMICLMDLDAFAKKSVSATPNEDKVEQQVKSVVSDMVDQTVKQTVLLHETHSTPQSRPSIL